MSYSSINDMATNPSLISRIGACAAQEGAQGDPFQWAKANIWQIVTNAAWVDAWDYAKGSYNVNVNPDTGMRTDVITDAMILAAVQPIVQAELAAI